MPRYIVERTFPGGLTIDSTPEGAERCLGIVGNNTREQVVWMQSFVSADGTKTFEVYEGPSPEAIRRAARLSSLPVDTITQISVLDPYFHLLRIP